ncbi:MAG: TetR/AcrR family transcriptional regulator [Ktedonobacterales bacterium]|jgi:AcrR family transcriptional regulator
MARKPAPPGSDRRQQILEAALDLFAEQGLAGATSKDIAERAEVTHGLIYFYFKTKEELYKAAFEYALKRALEQLDLAAIAQSDEPPEEALTPLLTRFLDTLHSPTLLSISRMMMHTMAHHDWRDGPLYDCKLRMRDTVSLIVSEVRDYLDRQVALGRLRPINTQVVAMFLVGGVASSLRWSHGDTHASDQASDNPQVTAAAITDTLMRGLRIDGEESASTLAAVVVTTPGAAPPDQPDQPDTTRAAPALVATLADASSTA